MRRHTIFYSYRRLLLLPVMLLAGCAGPEASRPEAAAKMPTPVAAAARTVTGHVTGRSAVPEAGRSRYPDCYFTAEFRVDENAAAVIPSVITLILPGFLDRRVTPEDGFGVGDRLRVTVVEFETLDESAQSVRIADTLGDVTSPWYWCFRAEKLPPQGVTP